METRKRSIGLIVFWFCVLLMPLWWQASARAATTPPTIDDIVGTYTVADKETYYYFDDGVPRKDYYTGVYALTWRITKTSDSTVHVYIDNWDWPFEAYYKNGFLVQSAGDLINNTSPWGFWVALGIAQFSGKPGKIKFKGDFGWGQYGGLDEYCEWDPYAGKMISIDPNYLGSTLASQVDEEAVFVPEKEVISLAATPPLGIDDILGTYSCKLAGTMYHPTAGMKEKGSLSDTVTIDKVDNYTVNISSTSGWNLQARCGTNILMIADADNPDLDANASFGILLAKGKPGKISLKGKLYSIMGLGEPDDEFEVAKVSCKQSSP
jgi:hypothetical protein